MAAGRAGKREALKLNDAAKKLLEEQMWYLATYAEEPNAVPVLFREAAGDGPLCDRGAQEVQAGGGDRLPGRGYRQGALIITPERVIVTTPGADNKKVL